MTTCPTCEYDDFELTITNCIDCRKGTCEACQLEGPDGIVCESCGDKRNSKLLGEES